MFLKDDVEYCMNNDVDYIVLPIYKGSSDIVEIKKVI